MRIYRLYIRLAFGGLRFHVAGALAEIVAESLRFGGMGLTTVIMEG